MFSLFDNFNCIFFIFFSNLDNDNINKIFFSNNNLIFFNLIFILSFTYWFWRISNFRHVSRLSRWCWWWSSHFCNIFICWNETKYGKIVVCYDLLHIYDCSMPMHLNKSKHFRCFWADLDQTNFEYFFQKCLYLTWKSREKMQKFSRNENRRKMFQKKFCANHSIFLK